MADEESRELISRAVRLCWGDPSLRDHLLRKITEHAKVDRTFYKAVFKTVMDIHGGKTRVSLSEDEKDAIAETFALWRKNYPSDQKTREAMNDFFALGDKAIEAIWNERADTLGLR